MPFFNTVLCYFYLNKGWTCLVCTYVNVPTRPGCELCGADRPVDYKPPPNVEIDGRELERLRTEMESEALLLQVLSGR